jgi:hypothetical protein
MCEMLNLFVPVPRPTLVEPVRGLHFAPGGEIQRDFAARYAGRGGTILVGSGSKGCLCGFTDWDAIYAIGRDLLDRNEVTYLSALHFWSSDRYELSERTVDPEDLELCLPARLGEVLVMQTEPPEQRRHRRVVRALSRLSGQNVRLDLKSRRELHGPLVEFDPQSEVGRVGDEFFVAAQVLTVQS